MLKIVVPAWEDYDPVKQEFRSGKATTLKMEHSLVSLSKWEARHCKPFLGREELTQEELLEYDTIFVTHCHFDHLLSRRLLVIRFM